MPRLIVFAATALFTLSCSQEKPTAQPTAPRVQDAKASGSDECPTEAFNIEFQFLEGVDYPLRLALQRAANRWESVIQGDLPDIDLRTDPLDEWDTHLKTRVYFAGIIDDLRIIVRGMPLSGETLASSSVSYIRRLGQLPTIATIAVDLDAIADEKPEDIDRIMLHEVGHCLGFGTTTLWDLFMREWPAASFNDDPHFMGVMAVLFFDIAGGSNYGGKKVPVERSDGGHWRFTLGDELMAKGWTYPYREPLSEITIGALSDMGYRVSYWGSEHYATPTAASKAQTEKDARGTWCEVVRRPIRER